jgi:hypothetical protein
VFLSLCFFLKILEMKNAGVPNLCYERLYAEALSYKCSNKHIPYDGEFMKSLVIIDGGGKPKGFTTDPSGCTAENSGVTLPMNFTDVVCRQLMKPKRHPAVAVSGSTGDQYARVYVSGGYRNRSEFGDDTWYRGGYMATEIGVRRALFTLACCCCLPDPVSPVTRITRFPSSGSSDTVFNYGDASCDGCVYEYILYTGDRTRMLRNWSLHHVSLRARLAR